jgi:hypothetical protein
MALSGLEIVGIGATVLSTVGAPLALFFRYGVRLALVEQKARDAHDDTKQNGKDIASTTSRVQVLESTLQDIRNSLSKLNGIDEIKANVGSMKERLAEVVTKAEHDARWNAQDNANEDIREQLKELRENSSK